MQRLKETGRMWFYVIYHCGTNGAIQMTSPASTGYLFTEKPTKITIRKQIIDVKVPVFNDQNKHYPVASQILERPRKIYSINASNTIRIQYRSQIPNSTQKLKELDRHGTKSDFVYTSHTISA